MVSIDDHLQEQLKATQERVVVQTKFGPITGGRTKTGVIAFLEVPYAIYPGRFQDPLPLPADFRYEEKEYIYETSYCVQSEKDGQASLPMMHKVGLGKPTENPIFLNIATPPDAGHDTMYPVKVYFHGGFLQFGSPHGVSFQPQAYALERKEVRINVGYRLAALGFLASDTPKLGGNYGFKDGWAALQWIKENISTFGGNPEDVQISGLSAGAHLVHQLLHRASRLPAGETAPFQSALMQSNGIVISPKTPAELRSQFQGLCTALDLDATSANVLNKLRNPELVSWQKLVYVIENDVFGENLTTFRGCFDGVFLPSDPMEWQRSGGFAKALQEKGVRYIIVGDLIDEWVVYSASHPVKTVNDVAINLERYYQKDMVEKILKFYPSLPDDASEEAVKKFFGEVLAEGQVHLPVRMLARDLYNSGFPVLRYHIRWTPEQNRPLGYVTHGTDSPLWHLCHPLLKDDQIKVAHAWLDAVAHETEEVLKGDQRHEMNEVLSLREDRSIGWDKDDKWDAMMDLCQILPGEMK